MLVATDAGPVELTTAFFWRCRGALNKTTTTESPVEPSLSPVAALKVRAAVVEGPTK